MTIPELYMIWKEQREKKEFRSFDMYRTPEIAYEIRASKRVWNKEEIAIFSEYLKDKEKKSFVANLFAVQEQIPEALFEPFIDAAINERSPSVNQDYIDPCLRVFGFARVMELLHLRFLHGDEETRKGVGRAYYWARSPLVSVMRIGNENTPQLKGYLPKWNGLYYHTHHDDEMTESEVAECQKNIRQIEIKRRRLYMEEFLKNKDKNRRKLIAASLPKELAKFSAENLKLAKAYFKELDT